MNKRNQLIFTLFVLFGLLGYSFSLAQPSGSIEIKNPLECDSLEECMDKIINFIFTLAVIIAPLMLIIAGYLFITAAGNPQKITQARGIVVWTLIGFFLVLMAKGIVNVIIEVIGG